MNTANGNFEITENLDSLTYGFLGLGLMGGSFAKAIRTEIFTNENSQGKILASDCRIQTLEEAKKDGIIDEYFSVENTKEMLQACQCNAKDHPRIFVATKLITTPRIIPIVPPSKVIVADSTKN